MKGTFGITPVFNFHWSSLSLATATASSTATETRQGLSDQVIFVINLDQGALQFPWWDTFCSCASVSEKHTGECHRGLCDLHRGATFFEI